ncbi:MAG TPA: hypothetical protein VGG89_11500 [Candidatus Baltobacteraceae bacterium]|jgi:hypothetical protein
MRSAVALALFAVLAGCSSAGDRSSFGPYAASPRLRSVSASPAPYLYVASPASSPYPSGSVEEYPLGSAVPIRTIVAGIDSPSGLALDRASNLYVANYAANTVTVYAPGATKPSRTIEKGIDRPTALAFSHAGNLFVLNEPSISGDAPGSVVVFSPTGINPLHTITQGINEPHALAFDSADRLYVANLFYGRLSSANGGISVYSQGGVAPIRSITDGIRVPTHIAFNSRGHLYVSNYGTSYEVNYPYNRGDVAIYGAGTSKRKHTIRTGVQNPSTLAIDSQDVLYVTCNYNCTNGGIVEYEPGGKTPVRTLSAYASTLLIDAGDNLYAGNYNSVSVFAPAATSPTYTIDRGANALAFGNL